VTEVEEIEESDILEEPSKPEDEPFVPAPIPVIHTVRVFVTYELSRTGKYVEYHVDPDFSVNRFIDAMVKEDPLEHRLHVLQPDPNDLNKYMRTSRFLPNSEKMKKTINELGWKHGTVVLIEKNVAPRDQGKASGLGLKGEHYEKFHVTSSSLSRPSFNVHVLASYLTRVRC